jgi:hypothetical protein
MAQAAAQTATVMPQNANLTLGTSLSLPLSVPNQSHDNETPFLPEAVQNLADRIKSRSRKAAIFTQMAHVTSMAEPKHSMAKPQHPSSSPSKTVRKTLKRPSEDEISERPAQRHKTSQDKQATKSNVFESTALAPTPQPTTTPPRPINDTGAYLAFAAQVIKALEKRHQPRPVRFGDRQNETILKLLRSASPATREEMLFLTGTEAAQFLAPRVFHNGPILTEGQQPMPLQRIEDFLGEYYDDDSKVFVQDPSVKSSQSHNFVREVTIGAVKKRILQGKSKGRPWNCLELATHVEDGLRPAFLAGEDSRLLTKVKLEHAGETASRRKYPQGYKEVEKWALLAESGALTEPHQDSHGYSTYITVNQGNIGFGWLSFPNDEERAAWNKDRSDAVAADRFRYVVMKPGQTVFFPAGTVHFVFRLHSGGHTLAFGGHVLRCSNILHWIKTLIEEKASPSVTNEDLTSSAPGYLNRVEKFVKHAQQNGTLEKWGGAEAVEEFLRLKEVFTAME